MGVKNGRAVRRINLDVDLLMLDEFMILCRRRRTTLAAEVRKFIRKELMKSGIDLEKMGMPTQ